MLGVRYVIGRGSPPPTPTPLFKAPDYWVLVNSNALPRAFVPRRVETVAEDKARLAKLAADDFNPREVAYVESPVNLPGPCRGTASIVEEIPTRIRVSVQMETPGLVVLADLWDKGWQAYLERPARADSADQPCDSRRGRPRGLRDAGVPLRARQLRLGAEVGRPGGGGAAGLAWICAAETPDGRVRAGRPVAEPRASSGSMGLRAAARPPRLWPLSFLLDMEIECAITLPRRSCRHACRVTLHEES